MRASYYNAIPLALFSGVVVSMLVYLFYASALRDRIEKKLFDIRTRIAPTLMNTDAVAVVTISQDTIRTLGGRYVANDKTDDAQATPPVSPQELSYAALDQIVASTLAAHAALAAVLLPPQAFPYTSPELAAFVARYQDNPRVYFGTFDLSIKGPGAATLPEPFRRALPHVFKADITRDFRRDIIRSMVIHQDGELPFLAEGILKLRNRAAYRSLLTHQQADQVKVELNYPRPDAVAHLTAESLVKNPKAAHLGGKIVLIGYTAYRPWTFSEREATYINTPWQAEGDDVATGLPVVTLQAIGLINLLDDAWLRPTSLSVNLLQTIVVAVIVFLTWRFSIGFASFLFIGGWSLILILHSLLFSFFRLHVPLTDTLLWSSLATLLGAFWRLRIEAHMRVGQEAHFQAEKELAQVQDRFLSRFAVELEAINKRVKGILHDMAPLAPTTGTGHTAFARATSSTEELREYLIGIRQFSTLQEPELQKSQLRPVNLAKAVQAVVRQFDARKVEAGISFDLAIDEQLVAHADPTIVTQILYNLVSNAVKYSPPGSEVHIATEARAKEIALHVSDHGPGIAPELHERIFEKFYRVKDDFVYKHKGHGLGLYLSRFFARQIGANITLASRLGEGSTFTLVLRRRAP